jgi:hypothetical protein
MTGWRVATEMLGVAGFFKNSTGQNRMKCLPMKEGYSCNLQAGCPVLVGSTKRVELLMPSMAPVMH